MIEILYIQVAHIKHKHQLLKGKKILTNFMNISSEPFS
jgi:hypothetical protein